MKKFLTYTLVSAIIGGVAAGIESLVDHLFNSKKPHGRIMVDPEYLDQIKDIHFDFDRRMAIDPHTGEILIDFNHEKEPEKEMVKLMAQHFGM